jgi:hypothetical protein
MVDRVEKGWEDLNLEIPEGDGKRNYNMPSTLGPIETSDT